VGVLIGHLVRFAQRGTGVIPYWFQDITAWVSLLAVLGLVAEVIMLVVINPTLSPEQQLNLPQWQTALAAVISFYFGVRS
jgi:hypothetical protein